MNHVNRDFVVVLHLFCKTTLSSSDFLSTIHFAKDEFVSFSYDDYPNTIIALQILGPKADFGIMALSKSFEDLHNLQIAINRLNNLTTVYGYVSLTEVSEYVAGMPEERKKERLFPILPPEGLNYFCFYPMSKKRESNANWYKLSYEERKSLMYSHGAVGARFKGRILQLVTGSVGIDDYEWGVTLFGLTLKDIKQCVYEMRFDEASAIYAQFGPFVVGKVLK